jgi:hypothetical protein
VAELSPAAQAVLDAWGNVIRADNYGGRVEVPLAAALRAAADQVVPPNGSRKNNEIRSELLAIAAELEANDR